MINLAVARLKLPPPLKVQTLLSCVTAYARFFQPVMILHVTQSLVCFHLVAGGCNWQRCARDN